ncbi:cold-shock protein [Bradyrhizobium sp. LB11.1]|uniref:cold-shock protein n=1 Tax=Bradyrhizobium sp. LB11.1 TaxID=3156326 RepID=UPI003397BB3C
MAIGRLVRFNTERGFGFVELDYPPGADVFIHGVVLRRAGIVAPKNGQALAFEVDDYNGKQRVKSCEAIKSYADSAATSDD